MRKEVGYLHTAGRAPFLCVFSTANIRARADDTTPDLSGGFDRLRVSGLRAGSKQRRPEARARESEADGEQVAKHLRRAQHAVPLRRKNRDALFGRDEARWRS